LIGFSLIVFASQSKANQAKMVSQYWTIRLDPILNISFSKNSQKYTWEKIALNQIAAGKTYKVFIENKNK